MARRRKAARLTAVLGAFVVLCTAWALMLPAISITGDHATTDAGFFAASSDILASADDAEADAQSGGFTGAEQAGEAPTLFEQQVMTSAGETLNVRAEAVDGAFAEPVTMMVTEVVDEAVVAAAVDAAAENTTIDAARAHALAVDITFVDVAGAEVEPAGDVRVTMATREIAQTEELAVVHVDSANNAELVESQPAPDAQGGKPAVSFDAPSFSVYALVYTVDFEYSVDGMTYEYSLPGGGFISLRQLVAALGIASPDGVASDAGQADTEQSDGADAEETGEAVVEQTDEVDAEQASEADVEQAGETDSEELAETGTDSISENEAEVAAAAKKFVANVVSVEFSNPELAWVGKANAETTVGALKKANALLVQYSIELTEGQVAAIDAQPVEAGDWVLISLLPFNTEETLTITMKSGEQFVVRVTDASCTGAALNVTDLNGKSGALVRTRNGLVNAVQSTALNSTHLQAIAVTTDSNTNTLATEGNILPTQWTFEKVSGTTDQYYISSPNGYLNIGAGSATITSTRQALVVATSSNQTRIKRPEDNYALNNDSNQTANGYSSWDGSYGYENQGEWFTVFAFTYPNDPWGLNGKTLTIINNRDGGSDWQALRDEFDGVKDSRGYYASGNGTTYSRVDGVDYSSSTDIAWKFEFVSSDSTGVYYRIRTNHGYLFIDPNVTKKGDMPRDESHAYEHALRLESEAGDGSPSDGTLIRVVSNGDGTYLLQNRNGVTLWNYGGNQFWLSTTTQDDENATSLANSRFRLAQRMESPHVTVHYVDRNGNVLTGVQYTGGNASVIDNEDGTFTIPYNISSDVDLRANYNFSSIGPNQQEYTYANTHLDGKDASGVNLKHEGYMIDSALIANSGTLNFKSDTGRTNKGVFESDTVLGNLNYGNLKQYSLSGSVYATPTNEGNVIPYAQSTNKDIYVVLDPLPTGASGGSSGSVNPGSVKDPSLSKTMESNDDGTYTLSLKVDAQAKDASDTNKANVLFVVDTSSSMRATTVNNQRNRIMDTHDAVLELSQKLLAYNTAHPDAVEVSMITFDGGVDERLNWTKDATTFQNAVNEHLRYYYLHTGTDWEDGMKVALNKLLTYTDDDPTFVIFFTDGEPSQYTNFHGAGTNGNADPTGTHSGATDPGTGYPNFYSYFLSREASKDEMRAIVNAGASLYGVYAYNPPPQQQNPPQQPYNSYYGSEGGAEMLHNAIKYGYNASGSLEGSLFYKAEDTESLRGAFDNIFNLITESVGFTNVVVQDGIAKQVTSSTVVDGDVSAFTYTIKDKSGNLAYKVTVAPNGVPEGQTVADGTPLFWLSESGPPVAGRVESVPTTKVKTDANGNPILDNDGNIQTESVDVDVYYYEDNGNKFIMPISTTGENIEWDLSPLGTLKDGYSYEVKFVVWPNQDSYDLVADLNNGLRPNLETTANWADQPLLTDSSGRRYRKGGFAQYPYISRYEDTGVYSAMSNTDQKVGFYKVDNKIVNGEEVTIYTQGGTTVAPPDPMPLTSSYSQLEKQWNVERDPGIFAQYLYNTDGTSKQFKVDFDVFQGSDLTTPYTTASLGWDSEKNQYVWVAGDQMTNVTYAGHSHQIGTRWANEFSIATGMMLTSAKMDERGLNKSHYPSAEFEGETYYILEPGHDYTIKEHAAGTIGYEFDFSAPVYHPMLVDGVLRSVEIDLTENDDGEIISAEISGITGSEAGLSGLKVDNTLRGYINLNKVVVDENNQEVPSDNTKFEYTITLNSATDSGPFTGDHIPWYGISGLFYNDGHENYYQVYEAQDGVWKLKNEKNEEYVVISTGFDPDNAGAQTVTYKISDSETKEITLYGNQTTASNNGNKATATLVITQNETLNIANVPVDTEYTITESTMDEYELVGILKEVKSGDTIDSSKSASETDLASRGITGVIVTNRDNHVTFTNRVKTGSLRITKTIQKNGSTDSTATGTFYYAVYDELYDPDADPAQTPVRTGSIDVTANGAGEATEADLKIGQYYVYELSDEGGTPVVSGAGGIFVDGKYYAVTTTGSPATVVENETATAGIVNNHETIPVTATKTWADNNPEHLTVYFKLFYVNAGGVDVTTGTPLEPLAYGVTSVTWQDMPKYDENGHEYTYIVREYVLDEEHGEFSEGGHRYTEAAPNGYTNTESGLSVTNTKLETFEPVTTYSGLKQWVDTINGGATRPDGLDVTLMIDKEPYNGPAGDVPALDGEGQPYQIVWTTVDEDEWRYTFHDLPVFDDQMQVIRYYAVETPAAGYRGSIASQSGTQCEYTGYTLEHMDNEADLAMTSDADLVYMAARIHHKGQWNHIWTQRVPTAEEKTRLVELVNTDLMAQSLQGDATVQNVHWMSGLPIDHEFVYKNGKNGYNISFTRQNTNTIHAEVVNPDAFSNKCYGTLKYSYTAGSTDFKNELQSQDYDVHKTWGEGQSAPNGAEVVIKLSATVPGSAADDNPNPAPVQVNLTAVGVVQKTEVRLNGGAEGGDDTAQDPWKYSWTNLPQYDKDGHKITYSASEISYTIDGKTVDLIAFAPRENADSPNALILTNQLPSYSFDILKIDANTAGPLKGAQFTIQAVEPTSNTSEPTKVGEAAASVPAATGDDGKTSFNNVVLGYYEIKEVHTPDGYVITDDGKFYVKVDAQGVKLLEKVITDGKLSFKEATPDTDGKISVGNATFSIYENTVTLTVENAPGTPLPHTGGLGTTLLTALGSIMIAGAALLFWRRRRTV